MSQELSCQFQTPTRKSPRSNECMPLIRISQRAKRCPDFTFDDLKFDGMQKRLFFDEFDFTSFKFPLSMKRMKHSSNVSESSM